MTRQRNRLRALALAAICAAAAPALAAPPPASQPRLVIILRHGVRAPSDTPDKLAAFSARPWPAWPVAPGELTLHGAQALRLFAAWLRQHYAADGLWPAAGCPAADAVFLLADSKDHRTIESGEAVLQGAFPECGLHAAHLPQGETDPLFRAADAGLCPVDQDAARASILQSLPAGLAAPWPGYRASLDALAHVLGGASAPDCNRQPARCFEAGENTLTPSRKGLRLGGPLATAATLTEAMNLAYLEGMPDAAVGWGLNEAGLRQVMALHNEASAMLRENPVIAGANGGLLARAVLAALSGQPAVPARNTQPARATVLVGHDTNLANLAGILGLTWHLPDEADDTPPGGALVFRLIPGQPDRVQISMVAQTAIQIRELRKLGGAVQPDEIALHVPGCDGDCTLPQLARLVEARVPAQCRAR